LQIAVRGTIREDGVITVVFHNNHVSRINTGKSKAMRKHPYFDVIRSFASLLAKELVFLAKAIQGIRFLERCLPPLLACLSI
jgi:hypothetical protein